MVRHLLSIANLNKKKVGELVSLAVKVKKSPKRYSTSLKGKTLLTFFEMPSLRTTISFQQAMYTAGGNVIVYHAANSPWGAGKESTEDVGSVLSRYVDCIMVRMHDHASLVKLANHSTVPVINGMVSKFH